MNKPLVSVIHSQKVLFPEVVQFPMSEKVIFEKILSTKCHMQTK